MQNKLKLTFLLLALLAIIGLAVLGYKVLGKQESNLNTLSQSSSATENTNSQSETEDAENTQSVPAPDFTLEAPDGNSLSFLDLVGEKPIVLNFWASTCPPCKSEMPDFQSAYETYGEDILFVMLNVGDAMQGETRENATAFLEEERYTFPVYYDIDYSGVIAFGIRGFPSTFFIDQEGNVVAGASGMIDAQTLENGLSMIAPELIPTAS